MDLLVAMQSFVAVVQEGSMNAAARKLGVSGALVGQRVAALETRLDTRLLSRTTRHQSLTDFGATYFQQSLDILEMVAMSEGQAAAQQTTPQGKLRITAPVSFGSEALMPALPKFTELAPNVELDINLSDQNLEFVSEGVDAAFRVGTLDDSALVHRRLAPYRMMVCAAPAYLATHGTPLHPSDLSTHKAVGFARSARRPWHFTQDATTHVWTPKTSIVVNSGQALRVAACAGLGVVMQPKVLLAQDVSAGKLVQLFEEWTVPEPPMALLYHRDRHMPLRLSAFIEFALREFA